MYRQLGDSNSQWHKKNSKKVPVGESASWGTRASWRDKIRIQIEHVFLHMCINFHEKISTLNFGLKSQTISLIIAYMALASRENPSKVSDFEKIHIFKLLRKLKIKISLGKLIFLCRKLLNDF